MKKNIIALFLILLIFSFGLNAAIKPIQTKSFQIQAGIDEALEVVVEPVSAQSESYLIGIPFNIEEDYVMYSSTLPGRVIAHWSLLANSAFEISITAEQLHHVDTQQYPNAKLDYILTFDYTLSYQTQNNSNPVEEKGNFTYTTTSDEVGIMEGNRVTNNKFILGYDSLIGYTGNLNGDVYFEFTSGSSDLIKSQKGNNASTSVPTGNYEATVTITIKTPEGGSV